MKRVPHIKQTEREYRRRKRSEFRKANQAMKNLRLGSAYLPHHVYVTLMKAMKLLDEVYSICKPWWKNY